MIGAVQCWSLLRCPRLATASDGQFREFGGTSGAWDYGAQDEACSVGDLSRELAGLPHSAEGAAKIGADGLKPLNVIHRRRDSSQKKIGAVPTTSHADPSR